MKAVVKYARGDGNVALLDVNEPFPGPGQVKIQVKAAGVCGTDIHIFHDEYPTQPPVILGHEVSGIVVECGEGAAQFAVGTRVTSRTFYVTCGKCQFCQVGRTNLCLERLSIGSGVNGAFAKYVVVPETAIHALPENVSFAAGALCEPLACSVHATLETGKVLAGEKVLIIGPGTIGLLCTQLSKISGGYVVILGTESDRARLDLALKLGADKAVTTEDLDSPVKNGLFGFDVVLECSGSQGGVDTGLSLARKGARYVQVGLSGKKASVDLDQVVYKEIELLGSFAQRWTSWVTAIKLLERGQVNTELLVSDIYPLSRWQEAFDKFSARDCVKILLEPEE